MWVWSDMPRRCCTALYSSSVAVGSIHPLTCVRFCCRDVLATPWTTPGPHCTILNETCDHAIVLNTCSRPVQERSEDALPLIWKYVQALATEVRRSRLQLLTPRACLVAKLSVISLILGVAPSAFSSPNSLLPVSILCFNRQLPSLRQLMNFKHTKPDALHELCRQLRLLSCPQGTVVYRQGSVGTSMFVVVAGYVDLRHSPEEAAGAAPRGGSDDQGVSIMHSGPGLRFGLHTALGDARLDTVISMGGSNPDQAAAAQKRRLRAADLAAQARGPAELLQIDAEAYRRLSSRLFQREAQGVRRRIAHFRKLKLFENWPDEELQFIATWSFDARFAADDVIFNEGDALLYVYFPTGGSVGIRKVRKAGVGSVGAATPTADVLIHLEVVSAPAHFGEAELCRDRTTRETSVVALEDTTAIVIAGSVFQSTILGDVSGTQRCEPARASRPLHRDLHHALLRHRRRCR